MKQSMRLQLIAIRIHLRCVRLHFTHYTQLNDCVRCIDIKMCTRLHRSLNAAVSLFSQHCSYIASYAVLYRLTGLLCEREENAIERTAQYDMHARSHACMHTSDSIGHLHSFPFHWNYLPLVTRVSCITRCAAVLINRKK